MKSTNLFLPVGDAVFFNISLEQEFNSNNKEHAFFLSAEDDWEQESNWKLIVI